MAEMLSEKQLLAIQLLSKGVPTSQVAETVGVNRGTIYAWLRKNEFREQKKQLEKEILEDFRISTRLELNEILLSGKNSDKLRAIELIWKMSGEIGKNDEPVKELTVEEILQELGID